MSKYRKPGTPDLESWHVHVLEEYPSRRKTNHLYFGSDVLGLHRFDGGAFTKQ